MPRPLDCHRQEAREPHIAVPGIQARRLALRAQASHTYSMHDPTTDHHRVSSIRTPRGPLAWCTVLSFCAAITWGATWLAQSRREALEQEWIAHMADISLLAASHASGTMASAHTALSEISQRASKAALDPHGVALALSGREAHQALTAAMEGRPEIDVAAFVDSKGQLLSYTRAFPTPPISVASLNYFQQLLSAPGEDPRVSGPQRGIGGAWTFYILRGVLDAHGVLVGASLVGVSVDTMASFYNPIVKKLGSGASLSLYREDATLMVRWPRADDALGVRNEGGVTGAFLRERSSEHMERFVDSPRFNEGGIRQRRLAALRRVPGYPLSVTAVVSESRCLERWHMECSLIGVASLAACLAALAWAAGFGRSRTIDLG